MQLSDRRNFWHNQQLDISLMHALHVNYAYPPHSHDHYVICLVEWGVPTFAINGRKYTSPPHGLIFIDPGVVHTGEAATDQGLQVRSLYPTNHHMEQAVYELTGKQQPLPSFKEVYLDDPHTTQTVFDLHSKLSTSDDPLEQAVCFSETLVWLVNQHAHISKKRSRDFYKENSAVQKAQDYLEANYGAGVSLKELADHVGFSPYYFLRIFRNAVGMSPHEYLQDIRLRRAQGLIKAGKSLAEISGQVGFSSQSHMTRSFKKILGITPGAYAYQIRN